MSMRSVIVVALIFFAFMPMAFAQPANITGTQSGGTGTVAPTPAPGPTVTLVNPLNLGNCGSNGTCLEALLNNILDFVIRIGTIAIILMIVFVGYKFVIARDNSGKLEEARRMLLWTVVGALILLGAKAISLGIQATVGALSAGG